MLYSWNEKQNDVLVVNVHIGTRTREAVDGYIDISTGHVNHYSISAPC